MFPRGMFPRATGFIEIRTLEYIIKVQKQQYNDEITQLIENIHCIYSSEEVVRIEQNEFHRCLEKYDEQAYPLFHRKCNVDWEKGGGGNFEIRKRQLSRELNPCRGRLEAAILEANKAARVLEEILLQTITTHKEHVISLLPLDLESIHLQIHELLKERLHQQIIPKYPQGFDYFNKYLHHSIQTAMEEAEEYLVDQNRLKLHHASIESIVRDIKTVRSLEQAEVDENGMIEQTLQKYDEETFGANHLERRRAAIVEHLQKHRGTIVGAVTEFNKNVDIHRNESLEFIQIYVEKLITQLPESYEFIIYQFRQLKTELNERIRPIFDVEFEEFDIWVNQVLQKEIDKLTKRVIEENKKSRSSKLRSIDRSESVTEIHGALSLSVENEEINSSSETSIESMSPLDCKSPALVIPLPTGKKTHVFLSHDWGVDGNNHLRVKQINEALRKKGLITWLDDDRGREGESGILTEIDGTIAAAIDDTACMIVFLTENYNKKLSSGNYLDYCLREFQYGFKQLEKKRMIPVVLESSMKDTKNWTGLLGFNFGPVLYRDFSDQFTSSGGLQSQKFDHSINGLYNLIVEILKPE